MNEPKGILILISNDLPMSSFPVLLFWLVSLRMRDNVSPRRHHSDQHQSQNLSDSLTQKRTDSEQ
ncbi:hypothetical protein J6590_011920 [Homalodisca vitripennis]|nr:hypothetical protein J6590_011920 [Homalodisca vitripennis]